MLVPPPELAWRAVAQREGAREVFHNSANQQTSITNADSSRWVYAYDFLGQLTTARKYWSDGMIVAGQQFEYGYDDIGNRKLAAPGAMSGAAICATRITR